VCPKIKLMIRVQHEACSTESYESNEAYECHEGNELGAAQEAASRF
jgi:hypothetical protein